MLSIQQLQDLIRDVPDFPKPGIVFKDITTLLAHPQGVHSAATHMLEAIEKSGAEQIVGIESRGFIFGAAIAALAQMPFQLIRKPGKLPADKVGVDYDLEYGSDRVEMHRDAVAPGTKIALVDDLLATGGTAAASKALIEGQGGELVICSFVIELGFLPGREKLGDAVHSLIEY